VTTFSPTISYAYRLYLERAANQRLVRKSIPFAPVSFHCSINFVRLLGVSVPVLKCERYVGFDGIDEGDVVSCFYVASLAHFDFPWCKEVG
jgi:hypothetical protein